MIDNVCSLESWGGDDDWEFSFEPEVRKQHVSANSSHVSSVSFETRDSSSDESNQSGVRQRRRDTSSKSSFNRESVTSKLSSIDSFSSVQHRNSSQPELLQV